MKRAIVPFAALACACTQPFAPASYVNGLRVMAVKAEPPEVAPGQPTALTALAVDTTGAAVAVSWVACTEPALTGQGAINPGCFGAGMKPFLVPIGGGLSIAATVPNVTPSDFGPPEASGGLYLPVVLHATSASGAVDAAYRLRLAQGAPPNQNPQLSAVLEVFATSAPVPLDEATPLEVHAGDEITLEAHFAPGSAETYAGAPGQPTALTEVLSVAWFASGGSLSEPVTSLAKPTTVWRADQDLPAIGATIDLWIVGRDERGGTDWLHRTLVLR